MIYGRWRIHVLRPCRACSAMTNVLPMLCSICFNLCLQDGLCRGRLRLGRRAGGVGVSAHGIRLGRVVAPLEPLGRRRAGRRAAHRGIARPLRGVLAFPVVHGRLARTRRRRLTLQRSAGERNLRSPKLRP